MSYAAAKQFVSPQGMTADSGVNDGLPWELDNATGIARQETWLLSFIDILALLLTLFVLLLAHQDRIHEPLDELMTVSLPPQIDFSLQALQTFTDNDVLLPAPMADAQGFAMPGEGLLPQAGAQGAEQPLSPDLPSPDTPSAQIEDEPAAAAVPVSDVGSTESSSAVPPQESPQDVEPVATTTPDIRQTVDALPDTPPQPVQPLDTVLAIVDASPLKDRVEVSQAADAVNLVISDKILFARASASLSVAGGVLLQEVAALLQALPYSLSIEGHTDNTPIRTARYPSNWELSSARAAAVTRKLIEIGVSPDRLRAVGYGETRPRAGNATADGRARNRRVTFVLELPADS